MAWRASVWRDWRIHVECWRTKQRDCVVINLCRLTSGAGRQLVKVLTSHVKTERDEVEVMLMLSGVNCNPRKTSEVWSLHSRRDASARALDVEPNWPTGICVVSTLGTCCDIYEAVALHFNLSPTLTLTREARRASSFDFTLVYCVQYRREVPTILHLT